MSKVNWDGFGSGIDRLSNTMMNMQQMRLANKQANLQGLNTLAGVLGKGFDVYGDFANRKQRDAQFQDEIDYRRESDDLNRQNLHALEATRTNEELRSEAKRLGADPTQIDKLLGRDFRDSSANTFDTEAFDDIDSIMDMLRRSPSNAIEAGFVDKEKRAEFKEAMDSGDLQRAAMLFIEDVQGFGVPSWEGGVQPQALNPYDEGEHKRLVDFRDSFEDYPEQVRSSYHDNWSDKISDMEAIREDNENIKEFNRGTEYNPFLPNPEDKEKMENIKRLLTAKGEYEEVEPFNIDATQRRNFMSTFRDPSIQNLSMYNQQASKFTPDDKSGGWVQGINDKVIGYLLTQEGIFGGGYLVQEIDEDTFTPTGSVIVNYDKAKDFIKKNLNTLNIPDGEDFNLEELSEDQIEALAKHITNTRLTDERRGDIINNIRHDFQNEDQQGISSEMASNYLDLLYPQLDQNDMSQIINEATSPWPVRNRGAGSLYPTDRSPIYRDLGLTAQDISSNRLRNITKGWTDEDYQKEIQQFLIDVHPRGINTPRISRDRFIEYLKGKYTQDREPILNEAVQDAVLHPTNPTIPFMPR